MKAPHRPEANKKIMKTEQDTEILFRSSAPKQGIIIRDEHIREAGREEYNAVNEQSNLLSEEETDSLYMDPIALGSDD